VAPQRDETFKQKGNYCVQHTILQKFTNFHAIRSWSFQNICNETRWPRFFGPLLAVVCLRDRHFVENQYGVCPHVVSYNILILIMTSNPQSSSWSIAWINIIIFCTQYGYFTISNDSFKFNFLALSSFRDIRGPKFTLGGPAPPGRHLVEKILYLKRVLYHM